MTDHKLDERIELEIMDKDVINFMKYLLRLRKLTQDEYDRMLKNINKI